MKTTVVLPRRRLRLLAIAVAVGTVVPVAVAQPAGAAVGDARREVERVVDELDRLEEQADILAEDYNEAVDNKAVLDADIAKLEEKVAGKQTDLEGLRGDLTEVALRAFTGADDSDLMGPLFGDTASYAAGLRRDQLSRVALNVGTGTTDDLDVLIDELNDQQAELDQKRAEAEQLATQIQQQQDQVKTRTADYKQKRAEAEARLGDAIKQEEERRAQEAYNAMLARQAAAAPAPAAGGGGNSGGGNAGGGNSGGGNAGGDNAGGGNAGGGNTGGGNSGGGNSGGGNATPPPAAPAPKPPTSSKPVSGLAGVAVNAAMSQQGKPYVYATAGPDSYDCSGLTHYAWAQAGVSLPRNSRAQFASVAHVDPANAQPGDLIFFYSPISHVGLYLGGGSMVHAPNSGSSVKVSSVSWNKVTGVGRPG